MKFFLALRMSKRDYIDYIDYNHEKQWVKCNQKL